MSRRPSARALPLLLIVAIAALTAAGATIGALRSDSPPSVAQSASPSAEPSATPAPTQTGPVRVNVLGGDSRWESPWVSGVVIGLVLLLLAGVTFMLFTGPPSAATRARRGDPDDG